MADPKYKDVKFDKATNTLYCYRCKRPFFSRKYLESHLFPSQCPKCKRLDWYKLQLPSKGGLK
jgi:hypothetical protein